MSKIKLAGAALNLTPLDWGGNQSLIREAITQAREAKVQILCLPELCITGYGCEDAFLAKGTHKRAIESLSEICPFTKDIAVTAGLPISFEGSLYNSVCLIANQQIQGFVCKQHLANQGLHYEARWFSPWQAGRSSEIQINNIKFPIGDLCFQLGDLKLGFEICEDAWVDERPGKRLSQAGVNLILNPSASHFAFSKLETRKSLVVEGSRSFSCIYLYVNHLGNEAGRSIYDGGTLLASSGKLLKTGKRFSFKDVLLTQEVVDVDAYIKTSKPKLISDIVNVNCRWSPTYTEEVSSEEVIDEWEQSKSIKEEEFVRAVSLGLFDYMRKSFSKGFVVSLSGGADSAAISCLIRYSFMLALKELGVEGIKKKLSYCLSKDFNLNLDSLMQEMLTTVYQASSNSGEVTRNAAFEVAQAVGASHHEVSVAGLISDYTKILESSLNRKLNWKDDDLTLQNIQARARGPLAWMFANVKGSLLLATSNRSEVAVGYATMDGDTCGGLCPIAGIDKAFLRKWLIWVEHQGPVGLGSIPELVAVNKQAPTAELRPGGQTDEGDLMPYDVLEFIERAAIRDKNEPQEILNALKTKFLNFNGAQYLHWVKLFFTLWSRSQWKRERYAPSFHLDDESLDPKTWCRFPILSGSYKKELSELKE